MPTDTRPAPPNRVLGYGRLGLIPFLAPGPLALLAPDLAPTAGLALAVYAALILSFLGGGRWGMAVGTAEVDNRIVSLAMLPSLAGYALLMMPEESRGWQLAGLAAAHILQGLWDFRSTKAPVWYRGLRGQLTLGAVAGLALGVVVFGL